MIARPDLALIRGYCTPAEGGEPSAGFAIHSAWVERMGALHLGATGAALATAAIGFDFDSGVITMLCCAAILLLGLPHGALDMVALLSARSRTRATTFYLALAGGMAALWWLMPGAALLLFFAVAIGHFSEDWPGPAPIAHGGALALLAAPLLFYHGEIDALFAVIAGPGKIPPLATALVLVAPAAIAAGLTGCALLWSTGRRLLALSSAAALAGMVLLPPLAGFALCFSLFHSPRQFARGIAELDGTAWLLPVALASGVAMLLVAGIAQLGAPHLLSEGIFRGTFVVLSVLTLPHMMLPLILRLSRA